MQGPVRLSIFPLAGAIVFPGLHLPLHIFEPRYRDLVGSALAKDRKIAMIQPHSMAEGAPLYTMGCVARISDVEAMDDGRYNIVLVGETRFRLLRELNAATSFRQIEAELVEDPAQEILSAVERACLEDEARTFAARQRYNVDWEAVEKLDDMALVNGLSQIAPFDAAAKQALLEAPKLADRCALLVQLMEFFSRGSREDDRITLQ